MIQQSARTERIDRGIARRNRVAFARLLALVALVVFGTSVAMAALAVDKVGFNDVRRILSQNCFKCHGPDAKERKTGRSSRSARRWIV